MAAKKSVSARKPSARKRARQTIKLRAKNFSHRSTYRTAIKKVRGSIIEKDLQAAQEKFQDARPTIDTMVGKGVIHRNKAARLKSRLNAAIKAMA